MKLNLVKFEKALIDEYKYQLRVFSENYAGKTVYGAEVTKANVVQAKVDLLYTIITALQNSVEKD